MINFLSAKYDLGMLDLREIMAPKGRSYNWYERNKTIQKPINKSNLHFKLFKEKK